MSKPRQLSKKGATLLQAFAKAAQRLALEPLPPAQAAYVKAYDDLRRYITRLEALREKSIAPKQPAKQERH